MKKTILISLLAYFAFANTIIASETVNEKPALSDRAQIIAAVDCFTKWDREGGNAESVAPCIYEKVAYQRVNDKGELIVYTPEFESEGKGIDDYVPYVTELEIFGNMAIVKTHKHRAAPNWPYMKAVILYKLKDGRRITNVVWGGITPQK